MKDSVKNALAIRDQIEALKNEMDSLTTEDKDVQKAIEFRDKVNELLSEYGYSVDDLAEVFQLTLPSKGSAERKKRAMLVYHNPHTGEEVKTRGANHKTLKAWREKYGADTVDSWKKPLKN